MTTLDTIAMIVGYITLILLVLFVFLVMPLVHIGRHNAERNKEIYRREMMARGMDPHIDPKQL